MRDLSMHLFTSLPSLETSQEQFIVVCFLVANMGSDCETNGFFIQLFGRCASTDAPAILTAGKLCNYFLSSNRTTRIQFTNAIGKTCYVFRFMTIIIGPEYFDKQKQSESNKKQRILLTYRTKPSISLGSRLCLNGWRFPEEVRLDPVPVQDHVQ